MFSSQWIKLPFLGVVLNVFLYETKDECSRAVRCSIQENKRTPPISAMALAFILKVTHIGSNTALHEVFVTQ